MGMMKRDFKFFVLFIFAGLSLLSIFSKFSHSKLSGVTLLEKSYLTDEIDFKPSDDVKKDAQWNELSKRKAFAAHACKFTRQLNDQSLNFRQRRILQKEIILGKGVLLNITILPH